MKLHLATTLVTLLFAGLAPAQQKAQDASTQSADAQAIQQQLPSYPLKVCPISGEALDGKMGKPVDVLQNGRLVRLCCKSCMKDFTKDPATTFKKIDDAVIQAQKASYPLKKCPVSGEDLAAGSVDVVQGTRLVRLCCKDCLEGLQKEPAKYLATIDAALITEQKKTYPLDTCVVSGDKIQGAGVDHLYGTRLVRFCCEKCVPSFDKEPAKYLAVLDKTPTKAAAAPTAPPAKKN